MTGSRYSCEAWRPLTRAEAEQVAAGVVAWDQPLQSSIDNLQSSMGLADELLMAATRADRSAFLEQLERTESQTWAQRVGKLAERGRWEPLPDMPACCGTVRAARVGTEVMVVGRPYRKQQQQQQQLAEAAAGTGGGAHQHRAMEMHDRLSVALLDTQTVAGHSRPPVWRELPLPPEATPQLVVTGFKSMTAVVVAPALV
jgi:hypothetical protein